MVPVVVVLSVVEVGVDAVGGCCAGGLLGALKLRWLEVGSPCGCP